jgi:hypothetical protein
MVDPESDAPGWDAIEAAVSAVVPPQQPLHWGTSGWGFELTVRVPADGEQPPAWALRLLRQLGRYVYSGQRPIQAGHRMQPGGPITGSPGTRLTALAFVADPQLPNVDSPNGRTAASRPNPCLRTGSVLRPAT